MSDCKEHGYYPYDDSRPCPYCRIAELEARLDAVMLIAGDCARDGSNESIEWVNSIVEALQGEEPVTYQGVKVEYGPREPNS
jgi:hypothetical protein